MASAERVDKNLEIRVFLVDWWVPLCKMCLRLEIWMQDCPNVKMSIVPDSLEASKFTALGTIVIWCIYLATNVVKIFRPWDIRPYIFVQISIQVVN